ncbi:hypothetical protein GCM10017673_36950 [Streptosporangium violaceochromogenes]|nr:hypothetical protein GCM10017673_36950 [Streptosporangium violaceochromogenes]
MPGARLTHEDRRRIADWVAEGLGYAEIARRLGRPTSTVSREVARNGGPGAYRADHAQRATGRRARRRGPVPAGGAAEPPADGPPDGPEHRFVERFATLLAGTGLPRMASRVFVCLLTSDSGSLTAAELVRRLQVSPASVSKAVGYLEAMKLAGRRSDPGRRRERYVVDDDVWLRAWRADTGKHTEVAKAARRGVEIFGSGTPAGVRLDRMGLFFARLGEHMGDSGFADVVVRDALTVLAALVYASRPLTADELAAALGRPPERVADALRAIERRPAVADPLTLRRTGSGAYTVIPRPDRLSPAQRHALRPPRGAPSPGGRFGAGGIPP